MNLTEFSLRNPTGVLVAAAVLLFFGLVSLGRLPVQLFPDIERPQMTVQTGWRAASPREIESEILEPQEEVLQGLAGLEEMQAFANPGGSWINLEFALGTDMQRTLIEVISRLSRMRPLPADSTPPVIQLGEGGFGSNESLTWFFIQLLPGTPGPIDRYQRQIEDIVEPRLEAIPGVAGIELMAGEPQELQIVFDPYRAAELGIQIPQVAAVAGSANDVSGGFVDVGRRQYTLRFAGRYTPEQLSSLILDWREGRPVRLGDIADIGVRRGESRNTVIQNGNPAMGMRVDRESGANVLEALTQVKEVVAEIREGPLKKIGLGIEQSFDASVFIYRAVALVTSSLFIGIALAIGVLWWFLRQWRATLMVAMAIPVSLLTTFVVLNATGRTLNVISLAGLAFAVGMVLDAAIVVLENIVRLREKGEPLQQAAADGTREVWGALVASTATTVAIFLPVIFLKDVEGQLFADLALTIAIAVTISLFVAVMILPTVATRWLTTTKLDDKHTAIWKRLSAKIIRLTDGKKRRAAMIAGLMSIPIVTTLLLMPHLDYLPPVKRDAVDTFFNFPPGANTAAVRNEIVPPLVERLRPYMEGSKEPALKNYYIWTWGSGGTIGARVKEQDRVQELLAVVRDEVTVGLPDTQAFVAQGNLFGGFEGNRNINVHIQSRDTQALLGAARHGMQLLTETFPGQNPRPNPGTELSEPELRLTPNDQRIVEAGWTRAAISSVVRALGDGLWIGEHFDGEKRMDVILRSQSWETPEELESVPLATPSGTVVPLGELIHIERTVGPSNIRRIDGRRTISLSITPPDHMSLQEAIEFIQNDVEPGIRAQLPPDGTVVYGGSASSLKKAVSNMSKNFLMALVVLFMLMTALFRSMRDSMIVLLSIPLATVGGVAAIRLSNLVTFQPMDLLTMIGFIILLGLVVNNAILLVYQTRRAEHAGMNRREAVGQALRVRMRPILMTTLTSIFGMLPLVLNAGAGSVIYRGLATVIVGGMSVSAVFTLLLMPALLRLGEPEFVVEEKPASPEPPAPRLSEAT